MKTEMISCDEVFARLWAFIDGELEPRSADEVRSHLAMCQMCYPRYDFQRAYFALMQRLGEAPEPDGLLERIRGVLRQEAS